MQHFVFLLGKSEARRWQKTGTAPNLLNVKASRFTDVSAGDVLWVFRIDWQTRNHDTFVCARYEVDKVVRLSTGELELRPTARSAIALKDLSLASAKLKVEYSDARGSVAGFKSSPWGGGKVELDGITWTGFRSGWVINPKSATRLEQLWKNGK